MRAWMGVTVQIDPRPGRRLSRRHRRRARRGRRVPRGRRRPAGVVWDVGLRGQRHDPAGLFDRRGDAHSRRRRDGWFAFGTPASRTRTR